MSSVYESDDYKAYIRHWISERPKAGRGESRRIAERLNVSTTLVSQVLGGDKQFTPEAASELCDHFGLSDRDSEHFLLLVDYARAGSHGLKARLKKKITAAANQARKLSSRVEKDRDLTDIESAVYYSHWVYTGITHLVAIHPRITPSEIANRFQMPVQLVSKALAFLLEVGILINRDGAFEVGAKSTHIGADSPLVGKHHQNWRLQGFNRMSFARDTDLFYTAPMSLSVELTEKIRGDLIVFIQKMLKQVGPSPSETTHCLNIDWFAF